MNFSAKMRDEMLQAIRSLQSIVVTQNARIVELEKGASAVTDTPTAQG